jgi:transcriptional regulator with XRE-family HTH domain
LTLGRPFAVFYTVSYKREAKMKKPFDMKAQREKMHLTLEQVAVIAGITAGAVRQIEEGIIKPKFITKAGLAEALGVTLRELMTEEEIAAAVQFMEDEQEARTSRPRKERKKD